MKEEDKLNGTFAYKETDRNISMENELSTTSFSSGEGEEIKILEKEDSEYLKEIKESTDEVNRLTKDEFDEIEESILQKRQGTVTYKEKGKNIGMPLEKNKKIKGMGTGRKTKLENRRKRRKGK